MLLKVLKVKERSSLPTSRCFDIDKEAADRR